MESKQSTTFLQAIARIFWMFIGPATLALLAIILIDKSVGWLAPQSIAFLVVLGMAVIARWIDPLDLDTDKPAAPGQVPRHMVLTLLLGIAVWTAANALGAYWSK